MILNHKNETKGIDKMDMMEVIEKKQKRSEMIREQRLMLDKIDSENRQFTKPEDTIYKNLTQEIDQLEEDILAGEKNLERRRKLAALELEAETGKKPTVLDVDPDKDFRNIGEFFFSLAKFKRDGVRDPRLEKQYATHEKREQTMGVGAGGGYAIPQQFDSTVRQVTAQEGIVRSRATVIPAGTPPDAKLSFPSLDQTSNENTYGGVTLVHTGEGVTMTADSGEVGHVIRRKSAACSA